MALKVGRIGHASLVVTTDEVTCFVDPILVDRFANGTNVLNPPVRVDVEAVRAACNAIVVSHAHPDHFSPRSLALFDRECFVFYPEGSLQIVKVFERLGFTNLHPMQSGTKLTLGDLEIIPTASRVSFPENGLLFRAGNACAWDCVDTVIGDDTVASVRHAAGNVDVMFAAWQPLNQVFWNFSGQSGGLKLDEYSRLLRTVFDVAPRSVVPASCGFEYVTEWLNRHGFPMSEEQFLSDVRAVMPEVRGILLPVGATISAEDLTVQPDALPFVAPASEGRRPVYDWRPDRGIPPLSDPNVRRYDPATLKQEVAAYLDDVLLPLMAAEKQALWRERLARIGAVWCLEVVYPDGSVEGRRIYFEDVPLRWSTSTTDVFAKMRTSIAASALIGLARGELDSYSVSWGMYRVAMRMYSVNREGAQPGDGLGDEPLRRFLFSGATEMNDRMIEFELKSLGV